MQDRFKYRAWSKKRNRYVTDKDIRDIFCNAYVKNHDLLELEDCSSYIVEQCTGLKDKNGKLIYEGDIVETHDYTTEHSQIVFDKGCYALKSKDFAIYEHLSNYENECNIIGNIHKNPELLEEE